MNASRWLLLTTPLLFWCGCESTQAPNPATATLLQNERPIDGMSRNVGENQGGAIHDPYTLSPPPVRRDYASER